jgi:hypothetical protein
MSCTPVSSTNKTDLHDINEKMLKLALNTTIHSPSNIGLYGRVIDLLVVVSAKEMGDYLLELRVHIRVIDACALKYPSQI